MRVILMAVMMVGCTNAAPEPADVSDGDPVGSGGNMYVEVACDAAELDFIFPETDDTVDYTIRLEERGGRVANCAVTVPAVGHGSNGCEPEDLGMRVNYHEPSAAVEACSVGEGGADCVDLGEPNPASYYIRTSLAEPLAVTITVTAPSGQQRQFERDLNQFGEAGRDCEAAPPIDVTALLSGDN